MWVTKREMLYCFGFVGSRGRAVGDGGDGLLGLEAGPLPGAMSDPGDACCVACVAVGRGPYELAFVAAEGTFTGEASEGAPRRWPTRSCVAPTCSTSPFASGPPDDDTPFTITSAFVLQVNDGGVCAISKWISVTCRSPTRRICAVRAEPTVTRSSITRY